jgi:hypothetical protein
MVRRNSYATRAIAPIPNPQSPIPDPRSAKCDSLQVTPAIEYARSLTVVPGTRMTIENKIACYLGTIVGVGILGAVVDSYVGRAHPLNPSNWLGSVQ